MNRRSRRVRRFLGNADAQALVEYALMIPLLLLLFFGLIQILLVAQVAQLGNYAAYAAARVYAVRSGVSGLDAEAEEYAKKAAALVLSPLSKLVPGEVAVLPTGGLSALLPGASSSMLGKLADAAEGFVTAYAIRLTSAGGGKFTVHRSGSPEQVGVELEFPYPIFIPGLAEAWSLVAGERNMKTHLKDMGVTSEAGAIGLVSPYPYVNIQSKCAMGYEPWSGKPRAKKSVNGDPAVDQSLKDQANKIQEKKKELDDALEDEDDACQELKDAIEDDEDVEEAQAAYDAAVAHRQQVQQEYNDLIGQNIDIPPGKCE